MLFAPRQQGVTLIEILVAMLVFSVGLLGASGMMAMAARTNHAGYLRTQVALLAQNMAERMRANPIGVWNGRYDGTYPDGSAQECAGGCTPAQRALYDRQRWSSQLRSFLPAGAVASIACRQEAGHTPAPEQILLSPPYGGQCAMTIAWPEQDTPQVPTQTFAWEFQP
jgi:type IV pilus assembly protein PilV